MSDRMQSAPRTRNSRSASGSLHRRSAPKSRSSQATAERNWPLVISCTVGTIFILASIGAAAHWVGNHDAPLETVATTAAPAVQPQQQPLPPAARVTAPHIPLSPAPVTIIPATAAPATVVPPATAQKDVSRETPVFAAPRTYGPEPNPAGGSGADFDTLIDLITTTTAPDTWEDVGGPGTISEYETGVRVDPFGRLAKIASIDRSGELKAIAARANLDTAAPSVLEAGSSPLRIVSLPRLERIASAYRAADKPLPDDVKYVAGLTAVQYVFAYPKDGDVVIAGPAEPWVLDDEGRPLGVDSGRPVLQLDDLVVLLRVFGPGGNGNFGCSINPREANLKQVKQFVEASQAAGPLHPAARNRWLRQLRDAMGLQDVEIYGVPRESRVAKIIFDADYRMKLIGIGKLDGGPNVPDFFTLLRRHNQVQGIPLKALRWWLTMKYDGVLHSPERDAFEIRGAAVLVQSEDQFVTAQGRRIQTGKAEPINREFAANFTDHYAEVAEQDKVFAELQNVFDLAMAAAICRQNGLFESAGWDMGSFAPGGDYQPAVVDTPTEIESVINHRVYGGRDIVVQVAGGVVGNVRKIVDNPALQGESKQLTATRTDGTRGGETAGRWWWDAAP